MQLLKSTIEKIVPQDQSSRAKAGERLDQLTMPHWALGRLMDLGLDLAGMTCSTCPQVKRKTVVVMAADHGVTAEGVSKYPKEVTAQMVYNFVRGGAGINAIANVARASVTVVDMGVAGDLGTLAAQGKIISRPIAKGTANMAEGPAMTREQAILSIEAGIGVAMELGATTDLFGTGDMGIGNTTPSAAIVSALSGKPPMEVTGRGTGIDDAQFNHKVSVIERALTKNNPDKTDGIDILSKVGGFEIGGIAGVLLGAAAQKKPVLVDGFISTAGALIAHLICPLVSDYIIVAHQSVEQGHVIALRHLGKESLLNLNLRLGEGTGAALAMNLVDAACALLTKVATFGEAQVSESNG